MIKVGYENSNQLKLKEVTFFLTIWGVGKYSLLCRGEYTMEEGGKNCLQNFQFILIGVLSIATDVFFQCKNLVSQYEKRLTNINGNY